MKKCKFSISINYNKILNFLYNVFVDLFIDSEYIGILQIINLHLHVIYKEKYRSICCSKEKVTLYFC